MIQNRIQFVGHSCVWITLDGFHFMVDANFSPRLFGFIKRHQPVGIDLQNLPDFKALLITHAHYDHLDLFSYKYFSQHTPIITPPGLADFIRRFFHNPVRELKPWAQTESGSVKIIAVPAQHFGFRISGFRYTHCAGYILQGSSHSVYIAGDTAYGEHFAEIGEQFKIDVALLPIGAYRPAWLMKAQHLDPAQAIQAFKDLKAKKLIPIHWGSFKISLEPLEEPLQIFQRVLSQESMESDATILKPGEGMAL